MKKLLFVLISASLTASAQFRYRQTTYEQLLELKKQEIRDRINFDYSVPDYNVSRPDEKVMGWRLCKILLVLEKNYSQQEHNQKLSFIRNEQMGKEKLISDPIDRIKVVNVQKQDSVITIKINTLSKGKKKKDDVSFDIVLSFTNSLSDDETANSLFSDIGQHIRKDEE